MTSIIRPLIAVGAVGGLIAGLLAAILIPRDTNADNTPTAVAARTGGAPAPTPAPVLPTGTPTSAPAGVLRIAPAAARAIRVDIQLRQVSAPVIAATVKDPDGGPDWAIRVTRANRVVRPGARRPGVSPIVGHNRCLQLGRLYRGRFGWLDARGTFRPVSLSLVGAPWSCQSAKRFAAARFAAALTTITDPRRPAAAVRRTIVWGTGGSTRRFILTAAGRTRTLTAGRFGTALALLPGRVNGSQIRLAASASGGRAHTLLPTRANYEIGLPPGVHLGQPAGDPPVIAATAPDPAGGLPYGIVVAAAKGGGWCLPLPGRVVGHRVGAIDYTLDVLKDTAPRAVNCPPAGTHASRNAQPFRLQSEFGTDSEPGHDPGPGRSARRLERGRTIYSGTADPDIKSLTFTTPQDVRTIIPTSTAHAFLLVYGATFPTGSTSITTTYTNGRTRTDTIPGVARP